MSKRGTEISERVGASQPQRGTAPPLIRASSLAGQVYEALRRKITEGQLEENQPLVIAAIVREFGVSQTPVREALARLHAEGVATFTNNFGYRVAPLPSMADYHHWMQARLVLEVGALNASATRVSPEDLAMLRKLNDQIAHAHFGKDFAGVKLFSELNREFHRKLIGMSANPFLIKAYDQIWLGAQFSRVHFETGIPDRELIAHEHQDIIRSLSAGDIAEASEALSNHIVRSLERDAAR
ncbi:GntR family transcriptional regulator [Alsobacter metallidurans]|uniref:GntR family transcriptional regulator n=1 Tax=Alsobacter metallidurans TaxID=340221 RepID=A0A917MIL3_9HYPH|nr:GntR family transcriptional regulator [Alsobacter metallidurans]GGH24158.1 GntR family transcriptional regulator [Alsobacter metallidurans]